MAGKRKVEEGTNSSAMAVGNDPESCTEDEEEPTQPNKVLKKETSVAAPQPRNGQASNGGVKQSVELPAATSAARTGNGDVFGNWSAVNGKKGFFAPRSAGPVPKIQWRTRLGHDQSCLLGVFGDPFAYAIDRATILAAADPSSSHAKRHPRLSGKHKVAAFDLDDTLIRTASGKMSYNFESASDWKFCGQSELEQDSLLKAVRSESDAGALLVLVTNQKNLDVPRKADKFERLKVWKERLGLVAVRIGRPFVVLAPVRDDEYRKPRPGWIGMLKEMWRDAGGEDAIAPLDIGSTGPDGPQVRAHSFYVGDAAGRGPGGHRSKADHGDGDRKLAANLGWKFHTPEEFFLEEQPAPFQFKGYHPVVLPGPATTAVASSSSLTIPALVERLLHPTNPQTLLILVGPQASGKSRIARALCSSRNTQWVRANRDLLKTPARCLSTAAEALKAGKSVVIDNTNPTRQARKPYIDLLSTTPGVDRKKVHLLAIHLNVPQAIAVHNDAFRAEWGHAEEEAGEAKRGKLPGMAFATYYKTLQPPVMGSGEGEGWDEVVKVDGFTFEGNEEERKRWEQWYT